MACLATPAVGLVLKDRLERNAKYQRDLERGLQRRRISILLDRDDGLPRDPDAIGEVLLGHLMRRAQFADLIAYRGHQIARR